MADAEKVEVVDNNRLSGTDYKLMVFQSFYNFLAHILVGAVVGICFIFSLSIGGFGPTPLHIVLCVAGYQLLMAEGILGLAETNGWSSKFTLVDKRRAHWIMLLVGSVMAITGSLIKAIDKNESFNLNWNTTHGKFGLAAMVFTSVSLFNGLASLWAYEVRGVLNGTISKISHICFGTVAFVMGCCCLIYAFEKTSFVFWITSLELAHGMIGLTAVLTFIVTTSPLITMYRKSRTVIQNGSL